ncbi:hypothetical protein TYRP_021428 [Tyrophagus putrescentiae]|nr:hypothetical protein TYRP_021428 [Tyrophagus putrescentiae]
MSFNYAHYLYRRWNADRQLGVLSFGESTWHSTGLTPQITIDAVRKLLREFRNETSVQFHAKLTCQYQVLKTINCQKLMTLFTLQKASP